MRAGVIGLGYWGPNLVRNLAGAEGVELVAASDLRESRRRLVRRHHPGLRVEEQGRALIAARDIDAIAIATPTHTHFPLARAALEAGKHVLVEKPMADRVEHAEELVDLARRKGLVLMVDHTYVYHPAVRKIHETIEKGELGDLYYYDSVRINLGLFQPDVSVLWDLGSHDASIMDHLLPQEPVSVQATGARHAGARVESMVYMTVQYDGGAVGHVHVNWLAPTKVRLMMLGGSRKMVIYDDNNPAEKVKIYDKGVEIEDVEGIYSAKVQYRVGDMHAPALEETEALTTEIEHFAQCVERGITPLTDGKSGLRVVRMLSAAERSLAGDGRSVPL